MSAATTLRFLLVDGRVPSGAHAHSWGLEAAIRSGLGPERFDSYLRGRLETTGLTDATCAVLAARAASPDAWLSLEPELAARTVPASLRAALGATGRGLFETVREVGEADPRLLAYRAGSEWAPRPVVLGAVAACWGIDAVEVARISLYEEAMGLLAAAVKLVALDMRAGIGLIGGLAELLERLASEAAALPELPALATPTLDRDALAHAQAERRLFVS